VNHWWVKFYLGRNIMSKVNKKKISVPRVKVFTGNGAPAVDINSHKQLRRLVNTCLLWENNAYSSGKSVAQAMAEFIPKVPAKLVAQIAKDARNQQKLRHAPLFIAREMVRASENHRQFVAEVLEEVIQRPDELSEFLAIYWKDGKQPLAAQVKKGLSKAFQKFNEYSLAKYNNEEGAVKLKDVLFLTHTKGKDAEQQDLFNRLVSGELKTPDTWETQLSSGADKKETFTRLLKEGKLGAMALLRNLRNMIQSGVNEDLIIDSLQNMKAEKVLPFRFISAAKHAPKFEPYLEEAMFKCLDSLDRLSGKTIVLVDVSGSMDYKLSGKSELMRLDAAAGLAMLVRETCKRAKVFTFSHDLVEVPARRGFALSEAINKSQPHGGTYLGKALTELGNKEDYDRIIVITDEQSSDAVRYTKNAKCYIVNVGTEKNGVGYGKNICHIDGWSDSVVRFIQAEEELGIED
jgi:uncharacterized protein with von Willebrand factor type A (vWA) domain